MFRSCILASRADPSSEAGEAGVNLAEIPSVGEAQVGGADELIRQVMFQLKEWTEIWRAEGNVQKEEGLKMQFVHLGMNWIKFHSVYYSYRHIEKKKQLGGELSRSNLKSQWC